MRRIKKVNGCILLRRRFKIKDSTLFWGKHGKTAAGWEFAREHTNYQDE
jgi:hypothetical protein